MFYTTTLDFTLMDGVVVDKTGNYSIQATEPTPLGKYMFESSAANTCMFALHIH